MAKKQSIPGLDPLELAQGITSNADRANGKAGGGVVLLAASNTISGTNASETLLGTSSNADLIFGAGGNDTVWGRALDDTIYGGNSDDTLFGESGNDTLLGDNASDTSFGGSGNDYIIGSNGTDSAFGGDGNDSFDLGVNAELIDGGTGRDLVNLTSANSAIWFDLQLGAASGNNLVGGDSFVGIDDLLGTSFNDTFLGSDGDNWLEGNAGNDILDGRSGTDSLFGGNGNDTVFYDAADAFLAGGSGVDTLVMTSLADAVQLDLGFAFLGQAASFEGLLLGAGNDNFIGSNDASKYSGLDPGVNGLRIFGGSGRDSVSMRGAGLASFIDDFVDTGSGNDQIWGGYGNDSLLGGAGDDFIYGGKGNDSLFGGSGFDVFYVGNNEGLDTIADNAAEVNGLVLFWGWDSTFGGNFDGLDPSEVTIAYSGNDVRINLADGGEVHFTRSLTASGWTTSIDVLNLWDYGQGEAGNSPAPPSQFARDVWSATFDATTGQFTAFTLAVNG